MDKLLLQVKNLSVSFRHQQENLQVVRGVDFAVGKGEIVGILGESGSGKTVSATAMLRLYEPDEGCSISGEIYFDEQNILMLNEKDMQAIRGKRVAIIFQNPSAALNPYKTVGAQLMSLTKRHKLVCTYQDILNAFFEVGLDEPRRIFRMHPSQLSGGQNQRVMIAQALLCKPDLLIADEPTSAIDASMSQKVLELLVSLNHKYGMSILLITHDFDVAEALCHRLLILYGGLVVEDGDMADIFREPLHPYTAELMKCARSLNDISSSSDTVPGKVYSLEGTPLSPKEFKDECPFYPRCSLRMDACLTAIPKNVAVGDRLVRCIRHQKGVNE